MKEKPKLETTAKERRDKFYKWISTDMLHDATGKTPIPTSESNNNFWKDSIVCVKCQKTYGGGIEIEGKTYCIYCMPKEIATDDNHTKRIRND